MTKLIFDGLRFKIHVNDKKPFCHELSAVLPKASPSLALKFSCFSGYTKVLIRSPPPRVKIIAAVRDGALGCTVELEVYFN